MQLSGIFPGLKITGVKRDIALLEKTPLTTDPLFVFDISLKQNLAPLQKRLLQGNAKVTWFDHHEGQDLCSHANLEKHISDARDTCTALQVNAFCKQAFSLWAAAAAFGDNLSTVAEAMSSAQGLDEKEIQALKRMGKLMNYNAYGESLEDLCIKPSDLAEQLAGYTSPWDFIQHNASLLAIEQQMLADQKKCAAAKPVFSSAQAIAYVFPNTAWARRYAPTFANEQVEKFPTMAQAMLMENSSGDYVVSIRSPKQGKSASAADLASQFRSGGGRALAAGINKLPHSESDFFLKNFQEYYGGFP